MLANSKVESDVDPHFYLKFKDIRVKAPEAQDAQKGISYSLTPQECRLRDITYGRRMHYLKLVRFVLISNMFEENKSLSRKILKLGECQLCLEVQNVF